jgi:hypothetical protein
MTSPTRLRRTPSLVRTSLYSETMSSLTSQVKVACSIQSRRNDALGFSTARQDLNPAIPAIRRIGCRSFRILCEKRTVMGELYQRWSWG